MSNSLWQHSILDPRKRGRTLSLRAPDDPLAYEDDGPPVMRSSKTKEWIASYLAADLSGDASERARAINGIIDANRGDHAMSGVPVYAHEPLPGDIADRIVAPLADLLGADQNSAMKRILEDIEHSARPLVRQQLSGSLRKHQHRSSLSVELNHGAGEAEKPSQAPMQSLHPEAGKFTETSPVRAPRDGVPKRLAAEPSSRQQARLLKAADDGGWFDGWRWPWESEPEPELDPELKKRNYDIAMEAKELQYLAYDPQDLDKRRDGPMSLIAHFDNRHPPGFPTRLYDREWYDENERGFSGSLTQNRRTGHFALLIRGAEVSDPAGRWPDIKAAARGQASAGQVNEVAEKIYQQILGRGIIDQLAKGRRLMVVGHSQGSPQAQLLGVYLITRALEDGVLTEEQALRAIVVRGFGGMGARNALRFLRGTDGRPLAVPPQILERIDAINYNTTDDPAGFTDEPYVGETWLIDTPGTDKYAPKAWWERGVPGHASGAYRAADYSTARRDRRKRLGGSPGPFGRQNE